MFLKYTTLSFHDILVWESMLLSGMDVMKYSSVIYLYIYRIELNRCMWDLWDLILIHMER